MGECGECESDLHGPHAWSCSRWRSERTWEFGWLVTTEHTETDETVRIRRERRFRVEVMRGHGNHDFPGAVTVFKITDHETGCGCIPEVRFAGTLADAFAKITERIAA